MALCEIQEECGYKHIWLFHQKVILSLQEYVLHFLSGPDLTAMWLHIVRLPLPLKNNNNNKNSIGYDNFFNYLLYNAF